MVAETLDLIEGTGHNISLGVGVHLETAGAQTQAVTETENSYPIKVRKPYIIKKQREKWTEEEHQRFLEALKLYGRAWRQIEEHVGSKTAIQIRSHAQKFFAKVARDSNDCEGSLNPIEIPPPRPKKKPIHPYPRKMVDIPKTTLVDQHQPEQSPPPKRSGEEGSSRSPTSVLSVLGSDTCWSPFSELQRSRLSPVSYNIDDAHSANGQFPENDNECMTCDSSVEEEKEGVQTISVASSAAADAKSTRELNLLTLGRACSVEDPATEAAPTTIKLFGRMVEIKEDRKLSSSSAENSQASPSDSMKESLDIWNNQHILDSASNNVESQVPFSLVPSCITPLPLMLPQYALSEKYGQVGTIPHIPLWTWSHGPVLPNVSLCNHTAVETAVDSPNKYSVENEEAQRELSSTGSNSGSVNGANIGHLNFYAIQSKHLANVEKQLSAKGFMPYKRCLAERDATSSVVAAEEREGQRARVCS